MDSYVIQGDPLRFDAESAEHAFEQYLDALRGGGYLRVLTDVVVCPQCGPVDDPDCFVECVCACHDAQAGGV